MSEIQQLTKEIALLRQDFTFVMGMLKSVLPDAGKNLWMTEEDVMNKMNLSKKSLQERRRKGELVWRDGGKGRKIQYSRNSVEQYLKGRSTEVIR